MKYLRSCAIIAVIVALFALIIMNSSTRQSAADQIWDTNTIVGDIESPNYYIMYTDVMCPYCDYFSRALMNHWEEFEQYLAEHKIVFEVRVTDMLYRGSGLRASRDAAEATYCAKREGKFWEYYHGALAALWQDYHSKGIANSKTAPAIKDMPEDYWLQIGHKVGLDEQFDNCVAQHETLDELNENTDKASQVATGLPYFKFNSYTNSGFDTSWDWDYVQLYLGAGLKN